MLESKIERDSVKAAEKCGWLSYKLLSQLNKGLPDRLFIKDGVTVYIEYKQPGKTATKLQSVIHNKFADHGVTVHICTSVDETLGVLNAYA